MTDLSTSRLHLVTGSSLRLRDECLQSILAGWTGPTKNVSEPAEVSRIIMDLDTPSLFEDPAAWIIRCDGKWLRRQAELLMPVAGSPVTAGVLFVSVHGLDKSKAGGEKQAALLKSLSKSNAIHVADEPDAKSMVSWLTTRVSAHPQGADHPRRIAEALVEHLGADIDALLGAIDTIAIYADQGRLTPEAVEAIVVGQAARPIWEFTGAVLEGRSRLALEQLHADGGLNPQQALSALAGEVRKLIACCDSQDDNEVASWLGSRGRPNLYYARQRAQLLGRVALQRLLTGCLMAQRQLRQTGVDPEQALETLVLHAQRVVRPAR